MARSSLQEDVCALLAAPATHGIDTEVGCIETHISRVFLAGALVYKMKKAVRLPFLDFSSLAARKAACEAELAVNRDAAPGLYRELCDVRRAGDGTLSLGGGLERGGEVVEWLVVMNRFAEEDLLSRMAERSALDPAIAEELATLVARHHEKATRRPDKGGATALRHTIDTNRASIAPFLPAFCPPERVDALTAAAAMLLDRLAGLLEKRRADGQVRSCHGDLHLANICFYEGRLCLFDAIEFSEDFSCIDVIYDLAFLLMDLDRFGRRDLANVVLNRYLADRGDWEGLAALPLFLSLRAAIRMHVEAARGRMSEAGRYLEMAEVYLAPPSPRLVAVGGLSGSGKSRLGAGLAPLFPGGIGAIALRSDVLRKQLLGRDWRERLGAEGYAPDMTERTYRLLGETAGALLAQGHSVVADAVFARPEERAAIEAVARRSGAVFAGFWLDVPQEVAAARISARKGDASDATAEVLARQQTYDLGRIDWHRLNADAPVSSVLGRARAALAFDR